MKVAFTPRGTLIAEPGVISDLSHGRFEKRSLSPWEVEQWNTVV